MMASYSVRGFPIYHDNDSIKKYLSKYDRYYICTRIVKQKKSKDLNSFVQCNLTLDSGHSFYTTYTIIAIDKNENVNFYKTNIDLEIDLTNEKYSKYVYIDESISISIKGKLATIFRTSSLIKYKDEIVLGYFNLKMINETLK